MNRFAWLAAALLACPGAGVYRNGQPIGATPVEETFVYYGKDHFRLVKDGYEPLDVDQEIPAPWYEWPPLDAVSEILNPYKLRDVHRFHYVLQPALPVRPDDVRARADALRSQGQRIGPPPPSGPPAKTASPPPGRLTTASSP